MASKVPDIRFKGYSDTWEQRKLSSVADNIGTGKSKYISGKAESNKEKYPVLGSTGIISYDSSFDYSGSFILTARVGANAGNLYSFNGDVKITDNTIFIEYENEYFLFELLNNYNIKRLSFGTGQPLIKASELKSLSLSLPTSMNEQADVGCTFSYMNKLITLHQRKLKQLELLKKALLQNMFPKAGQNIPAIRFTGFTDDWEQRKLSTFADRFDNLREPIIAGKRVNGDTPYYGANGIQDYVDGYTHDGDFLLIAEDGANDLSNYPVRRVNGKVWVNNHAHVVAGKMDEADNEFLANSFKTINIEPFLVGGGRAKLNSDVMMKLEFKLPEYQEQKEIGSLLGKVDDLLILHQRKLNSLEKLKKLLLQKMFI
ncbi:Restriction endonuclease S subunit (HsdS) [Fructobacillus fructosus]|uniref:Restriction endonuclease S subunit (HsdS) n=1 Tax=Fructobacillus fructosus TaxID=1631 RepID=A0ABN9YTS4_9LACO|nr:Restriction endonuclease S subunit (HsdS) [Fructobacillus fructosus]